MRLKVGLSSFVTFLMWLFCICIGNVFSQDDVQVISITSLPKEEFEKRQAEIDKMISETGLTEADKKALEKLRAKALEVAAMNDRCASMSINTVPDERCKDFFLKELPEFEEEFSKVTGNLYLNRISMVSGLQERKKQLSSCVQGMAGFMNSQYSTQNLIKLKAQKSGLEPIDDKTAKFFYDFLVYADISKKERLVNILNRWTQVCGEVIKDPDEGGFAPYFRNQFKEWVSKSDFKVNVLPHQIQISGNEDWTFKYKLNDKQLFELKASDVVNPQNLIVLDLNQRLEYRVRDYQVQSKNFKGRTEIPSNQEKDVQGVWLGEKIDWAAIRRAEEAKKAAEYRNQLEQNSKYKEPEKVLPRYTPEPEPKSVWFWSGLAMGVGGSIWYLLANSDMDDASTQASEALAKQNKADYESAKKDSESAASNRTIAAILAGVGFVGVVFNF